MSTASLSGNAATAARLRMPSTGIWTAAVEIEKPVALSGLVTFTIAGLSLVGTVRRGEPYQGAAGYSIIGGHGGWRAQVRARSFRDDSGVKLSRVLASAVSDMPEGSREALALDPSAELRLGTHWVRGAALASASLALLTVPWWIRADGSTFAGPRAAGTVADARAEVMAYDPYARRLVVGTEAPEAWVPGLTYTSGRLSSPIRLRDVTVAVDGSKMRVEVQG